MYWAQYIYLGLVFIGLGVAIARDGQQGARINFMRTLIASILTIALLAWGGFFDGMF